MAGSDLTNTATVILGLTMSAGLFLTALVVVVGFIGILTYWYLAVVYWPRQARKRKSITLKVERVDDNPVLRPEPAHWWESEAVFNPAAFVAHDRVHIFYRAMGGDGVSRIGYASSGDGVHFDDRLPYPVYDWGTGFRPTRKDRRYRPLSYNTDEFASGGGWGGCEDPRAVVIDETVYMTFGIFESWQNMRLAVTSMSAENLRSKLFSWVPHITMSPLNETHKNWVLFPEKIHGKFAILHALTPDVTIDYVNELEDLRENPIKSNNVRKGRKGQWDAFVRGAAAPPIKTPEGWLLFYHGMNPEISSAGYKVGAMLLDLNDPTKVLHRTNEPVLEPTEWYENDWKPGVVYASGAVVFGDKLLLYYGGGDKYIAVAQANFQDFLHTLTNGEHAQLQTVKL